GGVLADAEVLIADHVDIDEGVDVFEGALFFEMVDKCAAPVQTVFFGPLLEGLFAVEEGEPDGAYVPLPAEGPGHFDHPCGGGAAVVGADEFESGEVFGGVVVAEDDCTGIGALDDAVDIYHGLLAEGCFGVEAVFVAVETRAP